MLNSLLPKRLNGQGGNRDLAAQITKEGSKQTYYTFRLLADRDRVKAAFRAYAYFRWLDDILDCRTGTKEEKTALLNRQKAILGACYGGNPPADTCPEEQMLVDMIREDKEICSGLQIYLRNMMAVLSFDVERCGRTISHAELTEYTHLLSTSVTEVLYYVIGHKDAPTGGEARYHAVNGAHVVHLLRDTVEDISMGYFNVPAEFIREGELPLNELNSLPFRKWVYGRVKLARNYFNTGRKYIAGVKNLRCRLAGFAYIARFEWMLRAIERDQYCLRLEYPERKSFKAATWMVWRVFLSVFKIPWSMLEPAAQMPLTESCEEG